MNPQQYQPASADGQKQLQQFRSFIESLQDPVYRLAHRLLQDRELAAREVERTFVELYRRHAEEGFEPTNSSMRTAAYRVLIHRCKMAKASTNRRLKPGKLGPRTILEAVDALPDEVKLIVSLKYECQLSYEEIGEILEMSPERVKKGVWRSRERLSEWMEEPRSPLSFGIIMH
ncbi:RNA polymerase sigma factor [Paenibacillus tyrfis]|uniref:RNA polymerase sigma factor n=1 Tax=Paenibacillus tyrfis TaxID=1501230 RepID=UPI00209ECA0F|nr:sigma-70 family RNA polymerase sigma factor [Paenibacillus tyrfis]MCP1310887.1 sigma-70 family RNA polymerase sigma factor [Paenibacillus tyrfis]